MPSMRFRGQLLEGLAVYRQALRRWPTDAALFHDLAVTAREAANVAPDGGAARAMREEATRADEAALALDPNSATARNGLGLLAADEGHRRALDVDAREADAANGVGVLLVEANRPAEAAPWFERAIAAAPDLVEARLNLGIAYQQTGQTARAAEAYRQVLAAPARFKRERDAASKLLASLGAGR